MPFCSFSDGAVMFDVTPIENMFLLEYMPEARGDALRVYLYARMLCLHPELGDGVSTIARALSMEEDDVLEAFSYWEQKGLVEKLTDRPASYALRPLYAQSFSSQSIARADRYRDVRSAVNKLFEESGYVHEKQFVLVKDWMDDLGYTEAAVIRLLEYELTQPGGKKPPAVFKRTDKRAIEWAERGIRTLEDVENAIKYDRQVYSLASRVATLLSIRRAPTVMELECVRKWLEELHASEQEVLDACALTTSSRSPSIAYLDAILRSKAENGGKDERFKELKGILHELNPRNTIPAPAQVEAYGRWLEQGFEKETILLAAKRCAGKNWHSFDRLEEMLGEWAQKGALSHAQAELYLAERKQLYLEMKQLMQQAGLSRSPSNDDVGRYELWKNSYDPALMGFAAQCANGKARPIPYMEKLLGEWAQKGVATVEAAKAEHARVQGGGQGAQGSPVNFQQRSYTPEESKSVYLDLEKYFAQEDNKE